MSRVPTKQMENAIRDITYTDKHEKVFGKNKEHKVYYVYDVNEDTHVFMYMHYNTPCLYVEFNDVNNEQFVFIYSGAYSCSDRDNMNSMLYLLGINKVKVYKYKDNLYFRVDGKKTNLTKYLIE